MNTPSKHKKVIEAWASGATVRGRAGDGCIWAIFGSPGADDQPGWFEDFEYEIVPATTIVRFHVYADKNTQKIVLNCAPAIQKCDEKKLSILEIEIDSKTGRLIGFQNITP